jgi:dihydroorotase
MNVLLKNVLIRDPNSPANASRLNIFIQDGIIRTLNYQGKESPDLQIVEDVVVMPGWFDVGVVTGEPGFEHREDLNSLCHAAAAGGFTGMAIFPNTLPVIQSKSEIHYIRNKTFSNLVDVYLLGALSVDLLGKDLTEMMEMHQHGALGFTDGYLPIKNPGLLERALTYVQSFDGLILNRPLEHQLAHDAEVHEGKTATSLGLKGIPRLAEELMVSRDIALAEYTGARLHLHGISSYTSVRLIEEAKSKGIRISASVPVMNLVFDDQKLNNFDSGFKVQPPLREYRDKEALLNGLKTGVIDFICANHVPLEIEEKKVEFQYAAFGASTIEVVYPLIKTNLGNTFSEEELVEWLAIRPRKVLNLPIPVIREGERANLTLLNPDKRWVLQKSDLKSKAYNNPFVGTEFQGKVIGAIHHTNINL